MKKNLDFYCSVTSLNPYDFLSLKNAVNVPSKRNRPKNLERKNIFCSRFEGH
jgi:hypothetical protein